MARLWLRNARLLDPEAPRESEGGLLLEGGRIAARLGAAERGPDDARQVDLAGRALAPGLIDLHHHGRAVFCRPDAAAEAVRHDATYLARHGVTAFLVTTLAWPRGPLARFVAGAREAIEGAPQSGAVPLGIHLEGPWIRAEAAGAQPRDGIRPYREDEARELLDRSGGWIRMVTFAPEIAGAAALQQELERRGILGALGHSWSQPEDVDRAVERGARHVTHLFNAMSGLHHREPGLVGAGLTDERLTCDLICDGFHVHPRAVRLAARALGERLVLISDRIEPSDGGDFGAGPIRDEAGAWRLADGRLAGSSLTLERAIANANTFAGLSRLEAVAAATLRPARVLDCEGERGTLRPGARADLAIFGADGAVEATWVGGRQVWPETGS